MPSYDLLIRGPVPASFIVTAHGDETAESLIRECLAIDYAGEVDPMVLASLLSLISWSNGQAVVEAALGELLGTAAGGS